MHHLLNSDMLAVILPLVLSSTILAIPLARQEGTRNYTVFNLCPSPIDLYIAGSNTATIAEGGNFTRTLSTSAGYFFTDANGGSQNGVGTIHAGFYDNFYYTISDPKHANTGMRVKPKDSSRPDGNSSCPEIQCDGRGCPQAFPQAPNGLTFNFDPANSTMLDPPYYWCNATHIDYEITFCPTGKFAEQGQPIYFNNNPKKCLGVRGEVLANGTPVAVEDCIGKQAQRWIIQRGSTKVQVEGTDKCLDAGPDPEDGVQLKIWECYDNLPAQQWVYTDDNRIALATQGLCTDLENGDTTTGSKAKVQTWTCSDNNNDQVWTLHDPVNPTPPRS